MGDQSSTDRKAVYLGDVVVVPRSALSRFLEFDWASAEFDARLEDQVRTVVPLPLEREQDYMANGSVALDLAIIDYARGMGGHPLYGEFFLLSLARRPKLAIMARLRDSATREVVATERVTRRVSIGRYLRRSLRLSRLFGFRRKDKDLFERILMEALLEVVDRMRRHV